MRFAAVGSRTTSSGSHTDGQVAESTGPLAQGCLEPLQKALWTILTFIGTRRLVPLLPRQYRETIFYFQTEQPVVALTIDDGLVRGGDPATCWAAKVSSLLAEHNAHATFFVCSKYLTGVEEAAADLVAAGHELGNHMHEDLHNHYWKLSEDAFAAELHRTTTAIEGIKGMGKGTVRWFRAPQGMLSSTMSLVVAKQGLRHALGDAYADDWAMKHSTRFVSRTMLKQAQCGSICIVHMPQRGFREHTFESLSLLLDGLTAQGIKCVTLSTMDAFVRQIDAQAKTQLASETESDLI